jgi:hypothetical protein
LYAVCAACIGLQPAEVAVNVFANDVYKAGSYAAASRGIFPRDHVIRAGTFVYRFVDLAHGPPEAAADGPWWFEYEHYRTIVSFAERHGYRTSYAARLFAAILYEWRGDINAVVRARVANGPLACWKGVGKQVRPDGTRKPDVRDVATPRGLVTERRDQRGNVPVEVKMTPTQGPLQVLQVYIPGLGAPHYRFGTLMTMAGIDRIR